MTSTNSLHPSFINKTLFVHMLKGAIIGCLTIGVFLCIFLPVGRIFQEKSFNDAIFQFFPMLTGLGGGAAGGFVHDFLLVFRKTNGMNKILLSIATGVICLVLGWMSLVAGLSVTGLWD